MQCSKSFVDMTYTFIISVFSSVDITRNLLTIPSLQTKNAQNCTGRSEKTNILQVEVENQLKTAEILQDDVNFRDKSKQKMPQIV